MTAVIRIFKNCTYGVGTQLLHHTDQVLQLYAYLSKFRTKFSYLEVI
eukprot:SAG31_NODE_133_length_23315_cov_4.858847_10_plen_47_part_00